MNWGLSRVPKVLEGKFWREILSLQGKLEVPSLEGRWGCLQPQGVVRIYLS